jgi:hypothetical protein
MSLPVFEAAGLNNPANRAAAASCSTASTSTRDSEPVMSVLT